VLDASTLKLSDPIDPKFRLVAVTWQDVTTVAIALKLEKHHGKTRQLECR
jgi:hypothetical protein